MKLACVGRMLSDPEKVDGVEVVAMGDEPQGIFVAWDKEPDIIPSSTIILGTNTSTPNWHRNGLPIVRTPDALHHSTFPIRATVEHVFGLLLAVQRNLIPAAVGVGSRDLYLGRRQLAGQNLLVVGPGRIGKQVGKLAEAFGMQVRLHGPKSWYRNWEWADTIVVTATPSKRPALGYQQLWHVKEGATLVDVSQVGVVDYGAVWDCFADGVLRYVATDVVSPPDELQPNPRILWTPHMGGSTEDCRVETELCVIREMLHRVENGLV